MNVELLFCALKRRGKAGTAADLVDDVVGIAHLAGWPHRLIDPTPSKVSAMLINLAKSGRIVKYGEQKVNGRATPVYAPAEPQDPNESRWDKNYPMPPRPDPTGETSPMNGMSKRQMYALYDAMETKMEVYNRHFEELASLALRHGRELADVTARCKRDLLASGAIEA